MIDSPAERERIKEQAALYALGMLTMQESRAFERLISEGCEKCADELKGFSSVVAGIGLSVTERAPSSVMREKLLARIKEEKEYLSPRKDLHQAFVTLRADQGKWKEIGDGAFIKKLFVDDTRKTMTSLIKLLPGGRLKNHYHNEIEECYVLEGDYHVNGEVLGPGDYHCAMPGGSDNELFSEGGTVFLLIAPLQIEVGG